MVVFGAIFTTGLVTLLPVVLIAIFVTIPSYDLPSFLYPTSFILLWFRSVTYPIIEVTLTHEIRSAVSELCPDCIINCKNAIRSILGASLAALRWHREEDVPRQARMQQRWERDVMLPLLSPSDCCMEFHNFWGAMHWCTEDSPTS